MIPDGYILKVSKANEATTEKRFKRMGFTPERLDFQGSRPRPDFLVHDSTGPILVAEVKTFYSAGYLRERGAQISTADPAFLNSGPFSHPVDLSRIDDYLADSVRKYRALLEDKPEYRSVPLLAVLFFEFFADHFSLYPREMNHLPEVSGIAKIVNDYARRKAANELTEDELLHRINTGNMTGLPPSSKDFIVVENTAARLALPAHFAELCIREEQ